MNRAKGPPLPTARRRSFAATAFVLSGLILAAPAGAQKIPGTKSGFVRTPDGVRIHYLEAGRPAQVPGAKTDYPTPPGVLKIATAAPSLLFVPGWTMPAWIWEKQITFFAKSYRVIAMDPRSQGESTRTQEGLYPAARAHDIRAVVGGLHLSPVVLVGWSMGVTEVMAYVDQFGTQGLAGIVLVDNNAGGLDPTLAKNMLDFIASMEKDRATVTSDFIRNLFFKKPQPAGYVERVIQASLSVPTATAVALLVGAFAADYRTTLAKVDRPALVCLANSPYMKTAVEMQKNLAGSELVIFEDAGHALFVDDADRFNEALDNFLKNLIP